MIILCIVFLPIIMMLAYFAACLICEFNLAVLRMIGMCFVFVFRIFEFICIGLSYVFKPILRLLDVLGGLIISLSKPILRLLDVLGDFIISFCKFFGLRDKSDEKSRKARRSIERRYEEYTNALICKIIDALDGDGEEEVDNDLINIYYKKGDFEFVLGMNQYDGETHYFIKKIIEYRTPSYNTVKYATDFINKSDIMLLNRSPFVTELGKYFHAKCA